MPKNSVGKSFTVAIISGIEKVWIRGGGVSRFSVEKFLSHSAENFRRGVIYCCNSFGYRESLDKREGGGEYQDFPSKIFCLTVPKISVRESFTVAIISCTEKVWIWNGGGVSSFSFENFPSHSAENFRRESFTVAIISAIEKVWIRVGGGRGGGISRFSVENFLSHSAENFRAGILYCCNNFGYRKNLNKSGGGNIKIFRWKFFVSQCRKLP